MIKKLLFSALILASFSGFAQDNYLDFDGIDDFVDVAGSENILANKNTITLSCKVYPKNTNPGFPAFNGIAGYRNESNFDFYLIQLSATSIEARFRNSAGVQYTILYDGLVLNQWNHFFFVYDGAKINLYSGLNLTSTIAASGSTPALNSNTFKIGLVQFQAYDWFHNGYIDEVSLWNKALNASEINAIMANGAGEIANPAFENNLMLYYKFNQGTAYGTNTGLSTLNDENFAYDGQLNNFGLTGNSSNWGGSPLSNTTFTNQQFSVYPNPATATLAIQGKTAISSVQIFDLAGRLILSQLADFSNQATIEIANLTSGVYIAEINGQSRIRFVKE